MTDPFIIEDAIDELSGKVFHVIQDAYIVGGSKSRGLIIYIKKYSQYNEFVYAGPAIGYAQFALALACKKNKKKAVIFLSTHFRTSTKPTTEARKLGAKINIIRDSLAKTQEVAKAYCDENPEKRFLCPFGLDTEEFINIMVEQFQAANPPDVGQGRIWVTVGSGTILRVLMRIYPEAKFSGVIVGKKIWEDQFDPKDWQRLTVYQSGLNFTQPVTNGDDIPPYNSIINYDAKLWHFARIHGSSGDYIFNIAGPPPSKK